MPEALAPDGHTWSKTLELEYYLDNVATYGVATARELSRANARSYRNEKRGIANNWDLRVTEDGEDMLLLSAKTGEEFSLSETVRGPYESSRKDKVGDEVRETADLEIPTIESAMKLATQGHPLIVFPEQHITTDGVMVKFLTVWKQDEHDKKLYHGDRINLGTNIPINQIQENIQQVAGEDHPFRYHQDKKVSDAFVIFTSDSQVRIEEVKQLVASVALGSYVQETHLVNPVVGKVNEKSTDTDTRMSTANRIIEEGILAVRHTSEEIQQTVLGAMDYWKKKSIEVTVKNTDKEASKFSSESTLVTILVFQEGEYEFAVLNMGLWDADIRDKSEEEIVAMWIALIADIHNITPEQAHGVLDVAEETFKIMKDASSLIEFAVQPETEGVGIPAGLFALNILAHPETLLMGEITDVEVSVNQSINLQLDDEEPLMVSKEAVEAIITFFVAEKDGVDSKVSNDSLESIQVIREAEQGSLWSEGIDVEALSWIRNLVQAIDQDSPEQAMEKIEHEEEVVIIQMSELWEVFAQMNEERRLKSANTESNSELQFAPKSDTEAIEGSKREHAEDFSFAFTIWMLLKLNSYYQSLEALKGFVVDMFVKKNTSVQTEESLGLIEKLKERLPEGLIQKDVTQWIMLSIIWHMNMFREGGVYQGTGNQKQAKVKKKLKTLGFPQAGLIYAAAS